MPAILTTFTPDELTAATDVDLDHALARLFLLHRDADEADREQVHAGIMQVVGEMGERTGKWLESRGLVQ